MSDITRKIRAAVDDVSGYKEGLQNLMTMVKVQGLVILVLTGLLYYIIENVSFSNRYFALTAEGNKAHLTDLDSPNMNVSTILTWASQAAVDIMTFGFHDIDQRFSQSRKNFSPEGWESFVEAMGKSRLLKNVTASQQILTAIPAEPPVLLASGAMGSDYVWVVEMKLIMTIRAGGARQTQRMKVKMVIAQMPTAHNPMGMGIKTWFVS